MPGSSSDPRQRTRTPSSAVSALASVTAMGTTPPNGTKPLGAAKSGDEESGRNRPVTWLFQRNTPPG